MNINKQRSFENDYCTFNINKSFFFILGFIFQNSITKYRITKFLVLIKQIIIKYHLTSTIYFQLIRDRLKVPGISLIQVKKSWMTSTLSWLVSHAWLGAYCATMECFGHLFITRPFANPTLLNHAIMFL